MMKALRIGIIAGESSGDILGASLIKSLKKHYPDLMVEGVGGPRMMAAGCRSLFAMDRLSVMGLVEPLKRLPELLRMRQQLKKYFLENPPDVFIGIDSPDFTMNIERYLKERGIRTVHYVSPSVWAWRQGRIHSIKQSVNHMLTLFPFEQGVYEQHQIPVTFVGHPLADEFPLECDTAQYRQHLGLKKEACYVALLPGSREAEVSLLAPLFLQTAQQCLKVMPELHFLIPAANTARWQQLKKLMAGIDLPITLFEGKSHEVMGASNAVLMASGTTTLEAMLLKKPMVVAYKMAPLSYAIISRLLKTPYVSLPNLLANEMLVPELIQQHATIESLSTALLKILRDESGNRLLQEKFVELHQQLRCLAGDRATQAVLDVMELRP